MNNTWVNLECGKRKLMKSIIAWIISLNRLLKVIILLTVILTENILIQKRASLNILSFIQRYNAYEILRKLIF